MDCNKEKMEILKSTCNLKQEIQAEPGKDEGAIYRDAQFFGSSYNKKSLWRLLPSSPAQMRYAPPEKKDEVFSGFVCSHSGFLVEPTLQGKDIKMGEILHPQLGMRTFPKHHLKWGV